MMSARSANQSTQSLKSSRDFALVDSNEPCCPDTLPLLHVHTFQTSIPPLLHVHERMVLPSPNLKTRSMASIGTPFVSGRHSHTKIVMMTSQPEKKKKT